MKIIGFDNKQYILKGKMGDEQKSILQEKALSVIRKRYPKSIIWSEVTLPGSKTIKHGLLFADFLLPEERIIFEIHGEQHFVYNSFFHKNDKDFERSILRDKNKLKWCEMNDFRLIILKHDEEKEWKNLI